MKTEYIERIYAGWLAKIIGIRYGAPIEAGRYQSMSYGVVDDLSIHMVITSEYSKTRSLSCACETVAHSVMLFLTDFCS